MRSASLMQQSSSGKRILYRNSSTGSKLFVKRRQRRIPDSFVWHSALSSATAVHEHPLISNKLEQFRSESYALLKQLKRSVQLLNSASQLAARDSVLLQPIRRSSTPKTNAKIGNRSKKMITDHNQLSFSPAAA
ncbi:hypothetical protein AVEN_252551-1 [Araneus ventricosus]|uniref:Uncharacterized protein n=1 Tax=Araneus ventricosus TaxID=182803 RepID=A0A4Y2ATF3_ARAVE|nr:hypothetical protein AVEN_252551-1 [Araneus ventricosus]